MAGRSFEQSLADYKLDLPTLKALAPKGTTPAPTATTTAAGTVKKMANITNLSAAPTQADFNGLLSALRTAGLM